MTDIVEWLRRAEGGRVPGPSVMHEAADEIERLRELKTPASRQLLNIIRTALADAEAEIERLRAEAALWEERTKMGAEIIEDNVRQIDRLLAEVEQLREELKWTVK